MSNPMPEHTSSDVWNRLASQNEQITEISKMQAGTDARLHALESAVEHGFKSLSADLGRIADRVNTPPSPPNYMALIVLALGILAAFGGYSMLITGPIQAQAVRNEGVITRLMEDHKELAYYRGKVDALEERVRDMDNRGPRVWVQKGTQDAYTADD